MISIENMIEKIENYKENQLTEQINEDGVIYAPLKITDIEGFAVFSSEEYTQKIDSLKDFQNKHRYYYYEKFNNNNDKEVIFIMFNPSSASPSKDDPTIKNCRILAEKKYNSMEIINIFSERNPHVNALKIDEIDNTTNNTFIENFLSKRENVDVVIAWGYGKEKDYSNNLKEIKSMLAKNTLYKIIVKEDVLNEIKNYDRHPAPTCWSLFDGFANAAELTEY